MSRNQLYSEWLQGSLVLADLGISTGSRFFVDSVTGSDASGYGSTPDLPVATLDYAVALCTANKGDIIYVMPTHAENIAAAADIALDIAEVAVVGLGWGTYRPTFTFTTADTADIDIDAANVRIQNCRFLCDIDALAAGIDVNAAGFQLVNCFFNIVGTDDALIWVLTDAAADDMSIIGCEFRGSHAGPTACIQLVGADRARIEDNYIIGSYSDAAINGITTASLELLIRNNVICNSVIDKLWIDLVASCTGFIVGNTGSVVSTGAISDAAIIDAANCQLAENYGSDAVGETGQLVGVVSA